MHIFTGWRFLEVLGRKPQDRASIGRIQNPKVQGVGWKDLDEILRSLEMARFSTRETYFKVHRIKVYAWQRDVFQSSLYQGLRLATCSLEMVHFSTGKTYFKVHRIKVYAWQRGYTCLRFGHFWK